MIGAMALTWLEVFGPLAVLLALAWLLGRPRKRSPEGGERNAR